TTYAAALTTGAAAKILAGKTLAGISGTASTPSANACASDGATACLAASPYVAALTTGLASKVLSGNTVAGVAGSVTLPAASNVLTTVNYGAGGTAATGSLTLPTAANVRATNGAYGAGGNSVTPTLGNCAADGSTNCVAVAGYPAANTATFAGSNIQSGYTVAGVVGSAPIGSCTTDGQQNCSVSGVFKAANVTGIGIWDLRAGRTMGGISGALKTNCRNSITSATFNYDGALASLPNTSTATGTIPVRQLQSDQHRLSRIIDRLECGDSGLRRFYVRRLCCWNLAITDTKRVDVPL
ncbi:MAG: hypothetical protein NTZ90_00885, partial [Proteobacteria bacterium]|nr:hypothetical protein [Pseudomonadota bacterium]